LNKLEVSIRTLSRSLGIVLASFFLFVPITRAQHPAAPILANVPPERFAEMRYRLVGPFRAGRTVAADGIPAQPNVFFMAATDGGVWKTNDFGHTWNPIFDGQPTGSIGAIAVAPSDPNIIYVGSGEGLQRPDLSVGDGIYKSKDGGKSWEHLGLRDGQQIARILVDPKDPNRLFAAVLGHPYGPNEERGVFLSTDGAQTWTKVLYKDPNTGAMDLAFDPQNTQTIYADLWSARQTPWEGSSVEGTTSGLFKSTDGGHTWQALTAGLPTNAQHLGRIGLAVAPSDPTRLYADVDAGPLTGVYRSDDAGESWTRTNSETRVTGRGQDFAWLRVDPRNPDVVYGVNTSLYQSTDGGHTFTAIKGAPGGDDYHSIWINPLNPRIMLLGVDQGATITVNGGQTWSSWYNQPTAQFYHVATDNQFPYWIYGGQQESGSVGIRSRGDNGAITFRDWHPVGVEEYGYVAPDPLHPNLIYGGKVTVFDTNTSGTQSVGPVVGRGGASSGLRFVRTMPLLFSPVDPHILYLGSQFVMKTTDGGYSWKTISPDLSRPTYERPANFGTFAPRDPEHGSHRGVVYTIAPSKLVAGTIWAGTDDGLIHLTRDAGAHWADITPPGLTPWSKISLLEASHFDDHTAYAAINRFRLDDLHPSAFRTHDDGKHWQSITGGLPTGAVVNAIREDPTTPHLLYAGTEIGVFVSFNDGDNWQPLQLNLPVTSIRDLVIHEDDLVVATHGRSFWVLDDLTPLRQQAALTGETPYLFAPARAFRLRRNQNTDTPLPPEEPAGQNPPDGAILDFYLSSAPHSPLQLEIVDANGKLVRRYLSTDRVEPDEPLNVPSYWIRQPLALATSAGIHRWIWDLRTAPPAALLHDYPISAIFHDTPRDPLGVYVLPGKYIVRLTVDGRTSTQPITIVMDPRVSSSAGDLKQAHDLALELSDGMNQTMAIIGELRALRADLATTAARTQDPAILQSIRTIEQQASTLEGQRVRGAGVSVPGPEPAPFQPLTRLNSSLGQVYAVINNADARPTTQAIDAAQELGHALTTTVAVFAKLKDQQLPALNKQLNDAHLATLGLRAEIIPSIENPYDEGEEP
jgi:photosystem II stability/assembly factor-like uncharacterized protein